MIRTKGAVAPPGCRREKGCVYQTHVWGTSGKKIVVIPPTINQRRTPIVGGSQVIIPGPLFEMPPPDVLRLVIIPKRVVSIEVPYDGKIGFGNSQ